MISFSMTFTLLRLTKYFSCIALFFFLGCGNEGNNKGQATEQEEITGTAPSGIHEKTIVFFGNSLTAGYGLPKEQAYPALIQEKIDALNWPFQVVNAGLSGDTSEGGINRIDWILQQEVGVFVLELGANDGLRGVDLNETRHNLDSIIQVVHQKDSTIPVVLAGMKLPPNLGKNYASAFERIFQDLSGRENVYLIPFLLDGVAGKPALNLEDGIHPNAQGHLLLAENVWEVLKPILEREMKNDL